MFNSYLLVVVRDIGQSSEEALALERRAGQLILLNRLCIGFLVVAMLLIGGSGSLVCAKLFPITVLIRTGTVPIFNMMLARSAFLLSFPFFALALASKMLQWMLEP